MPKPRTPKAKARATGADRANPSRFDGRNEPVVASPLGDAPTWLTDTPKSMEVTAWETLRVEIPWLNASHRMHVAQCCKILGRVIAGQDVGVQALNLLRMNLGQMGGTPADASKAGVVPGGEQKDPADQYF